MTPEVSRNTAGGVVETPENPGVLLTLHSGVLTSGVATIQARGRRVSAREGSRRLATGGNHCGGPVQVMRGANPSSKFKVCFVCVLLDGRKSKRH